LLNLPKITKLVSDGKLEIKHFSIACYMPIRHWNIIYSDKLATRFDCVWKNRRFTSVIFVPKWHCETKWKKNNKKSISSYAAINTYNTVYPVLCTHMLLSYYEFPNIYHSMYLLSPRLFGVSAFHLHFQQYSIIFLKSFYFSWWLTEIVFTETPVSLSLKLPRNIARVNSRLHCSVQLRNVRVFVIMIDLLSFYFSTALFRTELSSWSGMLLYLLCPM
jgi:hypothetical protein